LEYRQAWACGGVTGECAAEAEKLVKIAILKLTELEMWANAQRHCRPAEYIGGALCSTPQSLADAHY